MRLGQDLVHDLEHGLFVGDLWHYDRGVHLVLPQVPRVLLYARSPESRLYSGPMAAESMDDVGLCLPI